MSESRVSPETGASDPAPASGRRRAHLILSSFVTLLGGGLVAMMVLTEDEPGALPLFLVLSGATWHFLARSRVK